MAVKKKSPPTSWAFDSIKDDNQEKLWKDVGKFQEFWLTLDHSGQSLLETVLTLKALKCAKVLLEKGISVEMKDYQTPPLSMPLLSGDVFREHQKIFGMLTALINHGADVNAVDVSREGALHVAARGPIGRALKPLWEGTKKKEVKPNPNLQDYQLNTPMHAIFLVSHDPDEVITWIEWCGQHNPDWTKKNKHGDTPLSLWLSKNEDWSNKARWKVGVALARQGANVCDQAIYQDLKKRKIAFAEPSPEAIADLEREVISHKLMKSGEKTTKKSRVL